MPRTKLNERIFPTDRWTARALSPVDISQGVDTDKYGPAVMFHPGWAKAPERYTKFLIKLADRGFLPIGLDTRYAYADRQESRTNALSQFRMVSANNPYFQVNGRAGNRWEYRRATVAQEVKQRLGVEKSSQVGHSEGGRIATLTTLVNPDTPKLVIINGAGIGDSSGGAGRMIRANIHRVTEMMAGGLDRKDTTIGALGSVAYTLSHPRRTIAEKRVIQAADTWGMLDKLEDTGVSVTVLHAEQDELISFEASRLSSVDRQWIDFIPTLGNHNNIYHEAVQDLVIQALSTV